MKKIEQLERKDSAWNKASMGEPVFVLRAKDPLAPTVVRMWALMAQDVKTGLHDEKVAGAFQVADDMEAWLPKQNSTVAQQQRQEPRKESQSVNVKLDVDVGIDIQTPDGRIVHVSSLDDLPEDVPQEVRDITQRLLDAKKAAMAEGGIVGGIDLRSIVGARPEPLHKDDELCDLCKAAGATQCLGDILPERSMDVLAEGLGFHKGDEKPGLTH